MLRHPDRHIESALAGAKACGSAVRYWANPSTFNAGTPQRFSSEWLPLSRLHPKTGTGVRQPRLARLLPGSSPRSPAPTRKWRAY